MNKRILGYLEGIIDGEGCLSLSKYKLKSGNYTYKPELSIANTDIQLINFLKSLNLGGSVTICPPRMANAKICYQYRMKSNALRILLPQIRLIIKETQRHYMLEVLALLEKRRYGFGTHHSDFGIQRLEQLYKLMRKRYGNYKTKESK